jgi:hypothetical protein
MPQTTPLRHSTIMTIGLLWMAVTVSGCNPFVRPSKIELDAAHQKTLEKMRGDYELPDTSLFPVGKTVWVYMPFEGPLTDVKASRKSPTLASVTPEKKWEVHHINVSTENRSVTVNYDIRTKPAYAKDAGYTSTYTETFNTMYQKALNALRHGYFDAETPPDFAVLIFADITRGIKLSYTVNLNDYKFYSVGQLPQEEFTKRMITEFSGDEALINDTTGASLRAVDIVWLDFLARQIENRVNFRFGRSSFPPSDDTDSEILHQIYQAFNAYQFSDCDSIILNNLETGSNLHIPCSEIENHQTQPLPAGGKLHTIQFFQ